MRGEHYGRETISGIAGKRAAGSGHHERDAPPARAFQFPEIEVRELRSRFGLTQDKFAALMGISVGTLRNWEQRRRKPEGPARVLL
jgi:putative transcriptional regulator